MSRYDEIRKLKIDLTHATIMLHVDEVAKLNTQIEALAKEEVLELMGNYILVRPMTWLETLENIRAGRINHLRGSKEEIDPDLLKSATDRTPRTFMFGEKKGVVVNPIPDSELPTDAAGNKAKLLLPEGLPNQCFAEFASDLKKTKAFTNVIEAKMAQRLINDLQSLIDLTNDEGYIRALQSEIKRLKYIASGEITKPSDVNYAWVIHNSASNI